MMRLLSARGSRVEPEETTLTAAENFFGKPEIDQEIIGRTAKRSAAGCLALRVPDPPTYAPPAICAISKDGKIAATGGRDVELALWDTSTGALLTAIRGHDVCWTTSYDNSFFVTVQEDSKVYLWDQHEIKQQMLLGHPDEALVCCSISLDDEYVIVGGEDGGVYSWDTQGGAEYRQYEEGHSGKVTTVMCYPMEDGSHVIISCGGKLKDHKIVVWDLETADKRATFKIDELENAKNVRYNISKDGTQVLVWCTDQVPFPNLVFVDALNEGKNSVYCHDGLIRSAVFGKDSAKIISCGGDGNVTVWDTASLEPQLTLSGHQGVVLCCGINEAGTHIVSSGEDCTVRLWSAEDGKQLQSMEAQDEPVRTCSFDKSNTKILASDVTGRVYVWTLMSEVILNLIRRYAETLSCIAMSLDQTLMAAGCNNGRVMMWDVEKRELIWESSLHAGRVEALAFNTLDELASAGADGRISVVSVETGKQNNVFLGNEEPILNVAFSPDDERIAGCSADGKLLLFTISSSARKNKLVLRSNIARVTSFVWSPNSKLIAGCCSDGTVLIWNANTGSIFTVLEGDAVATCCTFDYVGKLVAVGTIMGTVVIYNLETREMLCELSNNASAVRSILFSHDTTRLTSVCSRQAIVWDVSSTSKIRTFDFVADPTEQFRTKPHPYRSTVAHKGTAIFDPESETVVYDMATVEDPTMRSYFLSDTRLISCGFKGVVVWSAEGNSAPDKYHTTHDAITSCHFSYDDRLAVMGTMDGNLVVYDAVHGEAVDVIHAHQNGPCRCVRLSADNTEILTSGHDAKVILWDWKKKTPTRIYSGHFISVGCCDMAAEGSRVVSGDNHGMISIWEKETGHVVQTLPLAHSKAVLSVSISADGLTLASVGADEKVSIWAIDAGIELVSLAAAIESTPLCCAFSLDGNKLAVTESNGNVMVWSAMVGCQWYMIKNAHKGKVTSCSWSADCRRLVTCGADSVVATWDAESGASLSRFDVKSGPLTCVSMSPQGQFICTGSNSGTLSVVDVNLATRTIPEPSFLYNWLSNKEPQLALAQYVALAAMHPTLCNVQDAQGWSIINHAMCNGNAAVAGMVLRTLPEGSMRFGLISSVPYVIQTRVKFHSPPEDEEGRMMFGSGGYPGEDLNGEGVQASGKSIAGPSRMRSQAAMSAGLKGGTRPKSSRLQGPGSTGQAGMTRVKSARIQGLNQKNSAMGARPKSGKWTDGMDGDSSVHGGNSMRGGSRSGKSFSDAELNVKSSMQSMASFTQHVKKVAVELFTEKQSADHMDLIMNNALALALNSKSSECVQVLLDAVADEKSSQGSYHAITDMIPSLAIRYPYMCYDFFSRLQNQKVGELEVPVSVMQGLEAAVIRTAPFFTNVKALWQSHLRHHEMEQEIEAYAHVEATMVKLPFACALGRDSLLQTLVESNVPVEAYNTATIRAVIKHKWRLYGRFRITVRAVNYCFYTFVFSVYAALYSIEDRTGNCAALWASGPAGQLQLVIDGFLFLQAAYYFYMEVRQVFAIGLKEYFKSPWNILDLVSITLVLIITPFHVARVSSQPGGALSPMIAFAVILIYFKLFFYGLAFEGTGYLVNMVFEITWFVRSWCVLLFLNLIQFTLALKVIYQYAIVTPQEDYWSFGNSLLNLWKMVIGANYSIDSMYTTGAWIQIGVVLFSMYMFITQIILLNMLIAFMWDIYQQVKVKQEGKFLQGRARLIVEVETLMSKAKLLEYALMPPYLHLLSAVQRAVNKTGSIEARLERLEAMFRETAEQLAGFARGLGGQMRSRAAAEAAATAKENMKQMTASRAASASARNHPMMGPDGQMMMVPMEGGGMGYMDPYGMYGMQPMIDPTTGLQMSPQEQSNIMALQAQRLRDSESQLPAILRQIDRLQRTVNNQEMRMEGMVVVLRDIELLLRNQQPVIITQEARAPRRPAAGLSEADLEKEVKRLLGKDPASQAKL